MSLAILLGADPKKVKRGPDVFVPSGIWRAVADVKDTVLGLCNGLPTPVPLDSVHGIVKGPETVHIVIIDPGTEESISVFLEPA